MMVEILADPEAVSTLLERTFAVATALVTAASAIAALTPTPRDDRFLGKIYRVIEALALNCGRAKDPAPNRAGGRFTTS